MLRLLNTIFIFGIFAIGILFLGEKILRKSSEYDARINARKDKIIARATTLKDELDSKKDALVQALRMAKEEALENTAELDEPKFNNDEEKDALTEVQVFSNHSQPDIQKKPMEKKLPVTKKEPKFKGDEINLFKKASRNKLTRQKSVYAPQASKQSDFVLQPVDEEDRKLTAQLASEMKSKDEIVDSRIHEANLNNKHSFDFLAPNVEDTPVQPFDFERMEKIWAIYDKTRKVFGW